jgi:hypothetical protein
MSEEAFDVLNIPVESELFTQLVLYFEKQGQENLEVSNGN